ncbi:MAG: FtsB family cell division protein [Acidimicrobiales bacterium]
MTRAERRRAVQVRRSRVMVVGATTLSLLILVAWFPATALYHQHRQLASTSARLQQLDRQNTALGQEKQRLSSYSEVARIARQQYRLVAPGQQAYEVLPANGPKVTGDSRYPGDPAFQGPVAPSVAAVLPPGVLAHTTPAPVHRGTPHAGAHSTPGLVGRILDTFEFWR